MKKLLSLLFLFINVTMMYAAETEGTPVLEVDPASGSTLTALSEFHFYCAEGIELNADSPRTIDVATTSGNVLANVALSNLEAVTNDDGIIAYYKMTLPAAITTPGDYQISVHKSIFYLGPDKVQSKTSNVFYFTVSGVVEGPKLVSYDFTAAGGTLTFDQDVTFKDFALSASCNVLQQDETVSTANLEGSWTDWSVIEVTFEPALEVGDYVLDIPEDLIVDGSLGISPYEGGQIAFTIDESLDPDAIASHSLTAPKPRKVIDNACLLIRKNGRTYNVLGVIVTNH